LSKLKKKSMLVFCNRKTGETTMFGSSEPDLRSGQAGVVGPVTLMFDHLQCWTVK
jgi:hypothetical protein